jgi:uncharacterized protein
MQIEKAREFILDKINRELAPHFLYHNTQHAQDVCTAARQIALGENVGEHDTALLLTAALFHDAGLLCGLEHHEANSCDIARKYLPQFAYTDAEVDQICDIIMATRLPQTPKDKLGEIICDADLDYLGRNDFFILSKRLFSELEITHGLKTERAWDEQQVSFLKSHHYFTETAIRLRATAKDKHLQTIIEGLI